MEGVNGLIKELIEIGGAIGFFIGLALTVIGWLGKQAISNSLKQELEKYKSDLKRHNDHELQRAKHEFDISMATYKQKLENVSKSDDRIRNEILTWANPILEAVNGLESRLSNILKTKGYKALEPGFSLPNWSVTYDYFLNSTLFLFGQYFCWTHMLRQELSFELFRTQKEMKDFFEKVDEVNSKLSDFPPFFQGQEKEYEGTGEDCQIFRLQQRAIGELLATCRGGRRACRSYKYFLQKIAQAEFSQAFGPVRSLVDKLKPDDRRWKRLVDTHAALLELQAECNRLLQLPPRETTLVKPT